jgi:hypothetical protein
MLTTAAIALLALGSGVAGAPSEQASGRAREALAQALHVAPKDIKVTRVEARVWNDSSMGCGAPGTAALTVITEGYAVTAMAKGRLHTVHVSGSNAVVCDRAGTVRREAPTSRGAGIDVMMEKAREDLAKRLGVDAARIRLGSAEPKQWPDSGLGCPSQGESLVAGPVDGLVLTLRHAGRVFTYHTDRKSVRPCPAIEAE